ncbi:helix-turn-helix domain-containing protein [Nocardia farcinica]|uniref:helix-turn-helix domain-containing protein n=1 Tax=Nocardia farcinica TaxID=37329 RepID=UPI000BF29E0E|nr:helix-turn-helix domain-containing protein [Nocardia farcinica]MBF6072893.1 helix-turn-helix domain-containing protein [Nocardia farcinica]MBF6250734.1 helix-turn-helix domain-containing protein [Nocardia farcinica]MBF6261861.1 helix-turn-helix domain-containing protein [Nocardia farcinica]MBF6280400.1 helix-turn-helix domain-containing protein [Nocardia farcinica]MBF6291749.1 helix-turn-helix domain-containing protein [Nocardia farcinica]
MTASALEERTFLPEEDDRAGLAAVSSFLSAHEQRRPDAAKPNPSYALVGVDEHDRIELPPEVHRALKQIVAAMVAGKAVTVAPRTMTLTSQQAADLLGVSRPTVIRLIDKRELPAERVGNRHRLCLDDVLAYREARRSRQYEALAATEVDIDAEEDPVKVREQLREVRHQVAARRKAKG